MFYAITEKYSLEGEFVYNSDSPTVYCEIIFVANLLHFLWEHILVFALYIV